MSGASDADAGRRRRDPLLILAPPLAAGLIRLVRRSVRLRVHNREVIERFAREDRRYIHVFWHAHLLLMVYSYVGPKLVFMISRHRDGELIARTVERFGYVPARGSSTRGGAAALREMMRAMRQGADIGFTPDGPRGPARRVQPGCVVAAQLSGAPIVPVALGATRAWRLSTWDRFVVPRPGARVLLAYGEPLTVARDEPVDDACARVGRALDGLTAFAETHAGDPAVGVRP
ncbi:MAG: hypothetical protein Kow0062_21190 [Acidobacteriota bacterium]